MHHVAKAAQGQEASHNFRQKRQHPFAVAVVAEHVCLQEWTGEDKLGDALYTMLQRLPKVKWMVTTLGKRGSILLERKHDQQDAPEAVLDDVVQDLLQEVNSSGSGSSSSSSSSSSNSGSSIGSSNGSSNGSSAELGCTAKDGCKTKIRCAYLS